MSVMVFDHPLIKHKIAILRDKNTPMKEFRELVEEITLVMSYEAFKDAKTRKVIVETPLETRAGNGGGKIYCDRAYSQSRSGHGKRRT